MPAKPFAGIAQAFLSDAFSAETVFIPSAVEATAVAAMT